MRDSRALPATGKVEECDNIVLPLESREMSFRLRTLLPVALATLLISAPFALLAQDKAAPTAKPASTDKATPPAKADPAKADPAKAAPAKAAPAKSEPEPEPEVLQRPRVPPKSYLWEVTGLTNRVYLFGTIHAGKDSFYPLPDAVELAFEKSKVLVVEADITDAKAMEYSMIGMTYTPPNRLDRNLSPQNWARFRKQLARYGLPEAEVVKLKPFMAVSLAVFAEWNAMGFQPQFGVDSYLIERARVAKKRIVEIEGVAEQTRILNSFTESELVAMFDATLDALESGKSSAQIEAMVKAWQEADPEALLSAANRYTEGSPMLLAFEEKLVWDRHEAMLKKIEDYLNARENHFVAVGSLHLAGPRGLLEMLKAKGFAVRQL
jgi:uncharacterized protein YbaP (TraB family)